MILNEDLIDTFQQNCPEQLAAILNYSLMTLQQIYDGFKLPTDPDQPFNICHIYTNAEKGHILIEQEEKLRQIAFQVGIQKLHIILINLDDLAFIKRKAISTKNLAAWQNYFNFLALF